MIFTKKWGESFFVLLLLFFLASCGEPPSSSGTALTNPSDSVLAANISTSTVTTRASISTPPTQASLLSALLADPSGGVSVHAMLDSGTPQMKSYLLTNVNIAGTIEGDLPNNVTNGVSDVQLLFQGNDPDFGLSILASTKDKQIDINSDQLRLSVFSVIELIFPDDDQDGFSNLSEFLSATDANNSLSMPLPGVPSNVLISSSGNDVDINWDSVTGSNFYRVFIAILSTSSTTTQWIPYTTQTSSYALKNVLSSDILNIYVTVSAANLAGDGLSSPEIALNTNASSNPAKSSVSTLAVLSPIVSQSPDENASNVPVDEKIVVNYTPDNNIVKVWLKLKGTKPVLGQERTSSDTITFTPDALDAGTTYTATASFLHQDDNGNLVTEEYDWDFTTEGGTTNPAPNADTIAPTVQGITPSIGETDVAVNTKITIKFSEPIDPDTLDNVSVFYTDTDTVFVTGTWQIDGNVATLLPNMDFPSNMQIWVMVSTGVTDLAGNALAQRFFWDFTTSADTSGTPPTVDTAVPTLEGITPTVGEKNVAVDVRIKLVFSEAIDPASLPTGIRIHEPGGDLLAGDWKTRKNSVIFTPQKPLQYEAQYWVFLTTNVMDLAGNNYPDNFDWDFTTEKAPLPLDTTPPTLAKLSPGIGDNNVPIDAKIVVGFSEPIALSSIANHTGARVHGPDGAVLEGVWSTRGNDIIFTPADPLEPGGAQYIYFLTPGITDLAGNPAAIDTNVVFHTEQAAPPTDTTPPTLAKLSPGVGASNVPIDAKVVVSFSEPIALSSIANHTGARVHGPDGAVLEGVWSTRGNDIIFTAAAPLEAGGAQYIYFLTPGITDLAGNPTDVDINIVFHTENMMPPPPTDTTPPTLAKLSPGIGDNNVPIDAKIVVGFSEPIALSSIANHTGARVHGPSGAVLEGVWSTSGNDIIFTPAAPLEAGGAQYIYILTPGITDLAGNPANIDTNVVFHTESPPLPTDSTPPTLAGLIPGVGARNVPIDAKIVVSFSEPIALSSIANHTGARVHGPSGALVDGLWSTNGNKIIFTPAAPLEPGGAQYIYSLTPGITDLAGNPANVDTLIVFHTL